MARSFIVPERDREEEIRLLNMLGFPDFDVEVECENPYGTGIPLTAMLIRDSGEEYHSRDELSHSQFVKFVEEPEIFADKFLGEPDPEADDPEHLAFGKQAEHFLFHDEFPGGEPAIIPQEKLSRRKRSSTWFDSNNIEYDAENDEHHIFAKAGASYKAFCEANAGKPIMTQQEYEDTIRPLEKLRANVREHAKAKALMYGDGLRHVAIVFTCPFSGIKLRMQLDVVSRQKIIVDYKTAARNDTWNFAADFYKWKYHFQACWYREGVRQLNGGERWPVVYVVSEKQSKCFVVEVFNVNDEWFEIAEREWRDNLVHFKRCVESQVWKRITHDTIVDLVPPIYLRRQFGMK